MYYNISFGLGHDCRKISPIDFPAIKEPIYIDAAYNDFTSVFTALREEDHLFCISLEYLIQDGGRVSRICGQCYSIDEHCSNFDEFLIFIEEEKRVKVTFLKDNLSLDPSREDWNEQIAILKTAWENCEKELSKKQQN